MQWVWPPRGVKIEQEVEYAHEGAYLDLIDNGLLVNLDWEWTENMKYVSIAPVASLKKGQGRSKELTPPQKEKS